MVLYDPKSWWGLIFKFHKSDTFRTLLPAMLSVALYTGGVAYADLSLLPRDWLAGTPVVHSLLGLVISLLLVFRTNTAYERWWEGRRQWGILINAARNLSMKLAVFLPEDHPGRGRIAEHMAEYAYVLKQHLRGHKPGRFKDVQHAPNAVAERLFRDVNDAYRGGDLSGEQLLCLNAELTTFADVCGACERIQKTPIPYSYSLFLKKFIFVYIVSMPFCFAPLFHYGAVLLTTFMFYVLVSLEMIAEEVENPFGDDANDLPTDQLAETVRRNVFELLVMPARNP